MIYDIYQIGKATSKEGNSKMEALYKTDSMSDIQYIVSLDFEYKEQVLEYKGCHLDTSDAAG
mgnify:CR=1 FL=1